MSEQDKNGNYYCYGNYNCYGNSYCDGNYNCDGNSYCDGNYNCDGNYYCYGNYNCYGNSYCDGNYNCDGNYYCYGNSYCYGMVNSKGQYKSMFCINEKNKPKIFGVEVSEERADEIKGKYRDKCNSWYPKFTNAFELYQKSGNDWKKIPVKELSAHHDRKKAWEGMPKEAIDYIKSLLEFDARMFKEITGIDVSKEDDDVEILVEGHKKVISRKSAIALGLIKE